MSGLEHTGIDELDNLIRRLSGAELDRGVVRALNSSITTVRKGISDRLKNKYQLKVRDIKESLKTLRAKRGQLQADVVMEGFPVSLSRFKTKQLFDGKYKTGRKKKAGVQVNIYRDDSPIILKHIFALGNKKPGAGVPLFTRVGKARKPIEKEYSPPLTVSLKNADPGLKETEAGAIDVVMVRLKQQLKFLVERKNAR